MTDGVIFNRTNAERRFHRDLKREAIGRSVRIEHLDEHRVIHIGTDLHIVVESHWRLIDAKQIVVTDRDDGQWFGLPAPVDAAAKANERLAKETVKSFELNGVSGDLRFQLSNSLVLEILTNSSGYESWVMDLRGHHFAVGANCGLV